MTIQELQRIALRLSNNGWCRYWVHFNYPQNPMRMAVQLMDWSRFGYGMKPQPIKELLDLGFKLEDNNIYSIERTNDDGTPYISKL